MAFVNSRRRFFQHNHIAEFAMQRANYFPLMTLSIGIRLMTTKRFDCVGVVATMAYV